MSAKPEGGQGGYDSDLGGSFITIEFTAKDKPAPLAASMACRYVKLECPENYEDPADKNANAIYWGDETRQVHKLLSAVTTELLPVSDPSRIFVRADPGNKVRAFATIYF